MKDKTNDHHTTIAEFIKSSYLNSSNSKDNQKFPSIGAKRHKDNTVDNCIENFRQQNEA